MALHPVKLPKSARYLFRVVALQKKLLKALADEKLNPYAVNTTWVQTVWHKQDPEWVRKFCLGGQEARIQAIARATLPARQGLYEEFCSQNKVAKMLNTGGRFRKLEDITDFTKSLVDAVTEFFKQCYKLLSHNSRRKWNGYEFNDNRSITNRSYKEDFCCDYPTRVVCPYCDGEIGSSELDHYLCKADFPLLACSPWNLVPVCRSCNDMITAKGDRPAITLGKPCCMDGWLHPFFRPASQQVHITLNGLPADSIPALCSTDTAEQTRLDNHTNLIRTLSKRWTNVVASYHDGLVREVNRRVNINHNIDSIVRMRLEDHLHSRGKSPSSMIYAAVCTAVLDARPEYIAEFRDPNPPVLV